MSQSVTTKACNFRQARTYNCYVADLCSIRDLVYTLYRFATYLLSQGSFLMSHCSHSRQWPAFPPYRALASVTIMARSTKCKVTRPLSSCKKSISETACTLGCMMILHSHPGGQAKWSVGRRPRLRPWAPAHRDGPSGRLFAPTLVLVD